MQILRKRKSITEKKHKNWTKKKGAEMDISLNNSQVEEQNGCVLRNEAFVSLFASPENPFCYRYTTLIQNRRTVCTLIFITNGPCIQVRSGIHNARLCSVGYVQNHTRGIYPGYYPTKNFCKFCRTFIPVPGTCVSSVLHTRTRNFCKLCTPVPQIPGVRVQHFYTCPEAYVSYVALPYPYPQLV